MKYLFLVFLVAASAEYLQAAMLKPKAFIHQPSYAPVRKSPLLSKQVFPSKKIVALLRKKNGIHADEGKADRMAKTSWWIGLTALLCAIYPWYTLIVAIPLGIIAVTLAKEAKKSGSTKRNGRGLGTIALVLVGVWVLALTALLSVISLFEAFTFGG